MLPDSAWDVCKRECDRILQLRRKLTISESMACACNEMNDIVTNKLSKEEARAFLRVIAVAVYAVAKGYQLDTGLLELNSVIHDQKAVLKGLTLVDVRGIRGEEFGSSVVTASLGSVKKAVDLPDVAVM
jgi:hypothetical protein